MSIERFADFTIPDGVIERFDLADDDLPSRRDDTVNTRLIRVIRHAIGSKYEIVGTPIPPAVTSVEASESDIEAFRGIYDELGKSARDRLMARIALRGAVTDHV